MEHKWVQGQMGCTIRSWHLTHHRYRDIVTLVAESSVPGVRYSFHVHDWAGVPRKVISDTYLQLLTGRRFTKEEDRVSDVLSAIGIYSRPQFRKARSELRR